MIELTIAIPTFNRKRQLNELLSELESQTNQNFALLISDNASNYDITEIIQNRSPEFVARVVLKRNKVNCGASVNIANLFQQVNTKWMWIIGDDDHVYSDSVENILDDINQFGSTTGMIHYPLYDITQYLETDRTFIKFTTICEQIAFYKKAAKNLNLKGDFIFISNNLYNMELIGSYCSLAFNYSYTHVAHILPALGMLDDKTASVIYSNKHIVIYGMPCGDHWNIRKTALGLTTILDVPLKLNHKERKYLNKFISFDYMFVIKQYLSEGSRDLKYLMTLYQRDYKYILTVSEKIKYMFFAFMSQTDFSFALLQTAIKLRRKYKFAKEK